MQTCLYSPLSRDAYLIEGMPTSAVAITKQIERGDAIWNLMWLSFPPLDNLPGSGKEWYLGYKSDPHLFGAIVSDVGIYDDLDTMLHEHPAKFAAWFAKEDHSAWATYKVGGAEWVATVLARAEGAAVRFSSNVKIEGNVVHVKFGGQR
ncbi:MAG: hypothetical protein IPJ55_17040 [Chloracidobacterium sp.]|nr:hypothetical protein [Chloracidobacterium sp.]